MVVKTTCLLLPLAVIAIAARSQTLVDLKHQGKNVDFSSAASTKPFRTGTQPPSACSVGEAFFKTDAAPGQNWLGCTSPNVWTVQSGAGAAGAANYSQSFVSQTSVTIAGSSHGLGTANLIVQCYDSDNPNRRLDATSLSVNPSNYDVAVQFASAQTGRCVVNGSGGTAGGAVASVFGRTGTVSAQWGDYSFPMISGTAGDAQIASGLNAEKIGAGTVTNATFGHLAGVTSGIQQQLDAKAAAAHAHTIGGDLSGDVANATVARIQGRAVSAAAPAEGQALVWSSAASSWQPGTVSGGAGGAAMAWQLGDLNVSRTGATILTIGAACTADAPCNVRFGNLAYSIARSCTATLGAATATAFIYVANGGTVTIGHNSTISASTGCAAQSGVTSFPPDSIPLYTWSASNSAWDSAGGRDYRAFLSTKPLSAGTGIATVENAGRTIIGVDTAIVPTFLSAAASLDFPAIASGSCSADLTFSLPGASAGDAIASAWPSGLEAGITGIMRVASASSIAVRLCNLSGAARDPAAGTFRATVVRSF